MYLSGEKERAMNMFSGKPFIPAASKNESIASSVPKMPSTSVNYMHLPQKLPLKTSSHDQTGRVSSVKKAPKISLMDTE